MSECAFCGRDPYHYVDNGIGMERVAVTCCELGSIAYGRDYNDDTEFPMTCKEISDIATKITNQRDELEAYKEKYGEIFSDDPERCECCGPGIYTGLPGGACENCMNTGLKHPTAEDLIF